MRKMTRQIRSEKSINMLTHLSTILRSDDPYGYLILMTVKGLILLRSYCSSKEMAFILDDHQINVTKAANRMITKGLLTTNTSGMYALTKEGHTLLDELMGDRAFLLARMSDKNALKQIYDTI